MRAYSRNQFAELDFDGKNMSLTSRKALSRVHLSARNGAKKVT